MPATRNVKAPGAVDNLSDKFARFEAMNTRDIALLCPRERQEFFDEFAKFCQEVDNAAKSISDHQPDFTRPTCTDHQVHKHKRAKASGSAQKRTNFIKAPESPLPGDLELLENVKIHSVYEVMKSNKQGQYQYVSRGDGNGDNIWQAHPYSSGVGGNGRWNAGSYATRYEAACAVAVATAHRCHHQRVLDLMRLIPSVNYREV